MSELGESPVNDRRDSAESGGRGDAHDRARAVREALIGKNIAGRYALRALVGHGGMGAVYEAEHLGLGKRVAIKFIDQEFATDERVVARFAREARAMSAIESAHIVTVFDAGTEDGRPYLVMELLRGEDLGQRLRRMRRVPLPEAMHIVAQVLKGLAKAHAAGIVHRDLKPDNVFLVKSDTDPLFAKIVDFGVLKIERPRDKTSPLALTGRGTVLGTPFYMCPEQAQAMPDVDVRADIYSVGAILFECLTGRPPHTGETYEQIILSICMRDAPDIRAIDPTLSPEVASFVARALARERADRFPSAERMLAALHDIAPEEKRRVPLDVGSADTLISPGVLFPAPRLRHESPSSPRPRVGAETRIAGSGSSAQSQHPPAARGSAGSFPERAPSAGADARDTGSAALSSVSGRSSRKRSLTPIVVTAIIATLLGVGMMLAIISLLEKKTPPKPATQHVRASAAAPANSPASASVAPPTPTPTSETTVAPQESLSPPSSPTSATSGKTTPATRAPSKPTPTTGSGASTGAPKPLDISRDLP